MSQTGAYLRVDLGSSLVWHSPTPSCSSSTPTTIRIGSRHTRASQQRRECRAVIVSPQRPRQRLQPSLADPRVAEAQNPRTSSTTPLLTAETPQAGAP
ncbi:hypothetical protein OPT61_g258 [Boeremia exigua]|uniref:Uncharacterized protein n=1 Tax=Boeremia exigua TaxID=749465 RepID=A0ACC2IUE1_9PLEO|nr:hypothetical protein OPT61_g258 [Boeremia exigua]